MIKLLIQGIEVSICIMPLPSVPMLRPLRHIGHLVLRIHEYIVGSTRVFSLNGRKFVLQIIVEVDQGAFGKRACGLEQPRNFACTLHFGVTARWWHRGPWEVRRSAVLAEVNQVVIPRLQGRRLVRVLPWRKLRGTRFLTW